MDSYFQDDAGFGVFENASYEVNNSLSQENSDNHGFGAPPTEDMYAQYFNNDDPLVNDIIGNETLSASVPPHNLPPLAPHHSNAFSASRNLTNETHYSLNNYEPIHAHTAQEELRPSFSSTTPMSASISSDYADAGESSFGAFDDLPPIDAIIASSTLTNLSDNEYKPAFTEPYYQENYELDSDQQFVTRTSNTFSATTTGSNQAGSSFNIEFEALQTFQTTDGFDLGFDATEFFAEESTQVRDEPQLSHISAPQQEPWVNSSETVTLPRLPSQSIPQERDTTLNSLSVDALFQQVPELTFDLEQPRLTSVTPQQLTSNASISYQSAENNMEIPEIAVTSDDTLFSDYFANDIPEDIINDAPVIESHYFPEPTQTHITQSQVKNQKYDVNQNNWGNQTSGSASQAVDDYFTQQREQQVNNLRLNQQSLLSGDTFVNAPASTKLTLANDDVENINKSSFDVPESNGADFDYFADDSSLQGNAGIQSTEIQTKDESGFNYFAEDTFSAMSPVSTPTLSVQVPTTQLESTSSYFDEKAHEPQSHQPTPIEQPNTSGQIVTDGERNEDGVMIKPVIHDNFVQVSPNPSRQQQSYSTIIEKSAPIIPVLVSPAVKEARAVRNHEDLNFASTLRALASQVSSLRENEMTTFTTLISSLSETLSEPSKTETVPSHAHTYRSVQKEQNLQNDAFEFDFA